MSSASTNGSAHVAGGQGDLAAEHRLQQEALAEVLDEPARPHDRPLGARRPARPARCGGAPSSPRPDSSTSRRTPRSTAWSAKRAGSSAAAPGNGEVGVVRDVRGVDAAQRGRPGGAVVPVERRLAGAGAEADRHAAARSAARRPGGRSCRCRRAPRSCSVHVGCLSWRASQLRRGETGHGSRGSIMSHASTLCRMDALAGLLDGPGPGGPSCCGRSWTRRGRCGSRTRRR